MLGCCSQTARSTSPSYSSCFSSGSSVRCSLTRPYQHGLSASRRLDVVGLKAEREVCCRKLVPLLGFGLDIKVRYGSRYRSWLTSHSGSCRRRSRPAVTACKGQYADQSCRPLHDVRRAVLVMRRMERYYRVY